MNLKFYELLDRIKAIRDIEKETGRRVITFYRNASNNHGMIDETTYRTFSNAIDSIGNYDPLTMIIHTMGGTVYFGWRIACCLMNRSESVTVIVPEEALSMGTMITLSANEIIMFPNAHLSPIDPQVEHNNEFVPAWDLLESQDPLVRNKGKRNIELAEEYLRKACEEKVPSSKLDAIVARFLLKDKMHKAHASSILFEEAKNLGLPVRQMTLDNVKALHMQYKKHDFNKLDPSTTIEYTLDPLIKDTTAVWEKIRGVLESYKSDKLDLDKAQELLRLIVETDLID